ncbi:MAG: hypothetical protein WBA57_01135 [Elainellaceae cyanobacterium]
MFKRRSVSRYDTASQWRSPSLIEPVPYDPVFYAEMLRLYRFNLWSRWAAMLALWAVVGSLSLWRFRPELALMTQHFTWPALRYGLAFHPLASLGLMFCIGPTLGILFWQSRNILLGLSRHDLERLEQTTQKIRQQGKSHPLWRLVCEPSPTFSSTITVPSEAPSRDAVQDDASQSGNHSEFPS